jgi:hypothetical protein
MQDEFNAQVFEADELTTAFHTSADRVAIFGRDPEGNVQRISFPRETAERLAIWLTCRLDHAPRPKPKPRELLPLVNEEGRRLWLWDVEVRLASLPRDFGGFAEVVTWMLRNCAGCHRTETSPDGETMTFFSCRGLPGTMPPWANCKAVDGSQYA